MKNNQIYFNVKDGKVRISYKEAVPFAEFLQIISTGILAAMNAVVEMVPEELKAQTKEDLYDMYNAAASTTLNYFAPEIEMRPHLTTQAILKAENEILEQMDRKRKASQLH